jgi:hypothetical protein
VLPKGTSTVSASPPAGQRIKYKKQFDKLKTNLMLSLLFKRVLPKGTSTVNASPPAGQRIKYKNN